MMNRRILLGGLLGAAGLSAVPLLAGTDSKKPAAGVSFSRDDWKRLLDANQFHILFEAGTEPPGYSPLNQEKRDGTFICAACYLPLFDAETKYDSGTGWPSFWRPLEAAIDTSTDYKLIYPRTEYHCTRCKGHQGHVFKDGPRPTGLRYCNNGLALEFVVAGAELPALRG